MNNISSILYQSGIRHINIYSDSDKINNITSINYSFNKNILRIIINEGDCYIELFGDPSKYKKIKLQGGSRKKKSKYKNKYKKKSRKNTNKKTKSKKKHKKLYKKTRKNIILKGGNNMLKNLIVLISLYCFYFTITYTNPIISDSIQMTQNEYLNNFDTVNLENSIDKNLTINESDNIPIFGKCDDNGECTTENRNLSGKTIFASIDLIGKKRDSNLGQFFEIAHELPILSDHFRGFHQVLEFSDNNNKLTLKASGKPQGEDISFPKKENVPKFHKLFENVIKDHINAFKKQNMTDSSVKNYCVTAFYKQIPPSSYFNKLTSYLLTGEDFWHHDPMPKEILYDPYIQSKVIANRDTIASTFAERDQRGGPNEVLFSISYDVLDNPDIIQAKAKIMKDGEEAGEAQEISENVMGDKRRTILASQEVENKKATVDHSRKESVDGNPRRTLGIVVKQMKKEEMKKGMRCLVPEESEE